VKAVVVWGMAVALAATACKERRRTQVLESLVHDQEAPAYAELAARCRHLAETAGRLADAPSDATLNAARSSWREALVAWNATFPFRPAALKQRSSHFHAMYWPPEPMLMQRGLAGEREVDQPLVDELGVSAKGMYALETLLYGARGDPLSSLAALQDAGSAGLRRRAFVRALAADVSRLAGDAASIVGDAGFPATFARAGQPALNALVNDQIAVLEGLLTERLTFMVGAFQSGSLAKLPYQGRASASSFAITEAQLGGVAAIYGRVPGAGVSRLVRSSSEDADQAVRDALGRAVASVHSLGGPLEDAVTRDAKAVERAADDVRAAEVLFKTNVASALGITLTFTGRDGD
jgi:predicted lipoprotein